MKTLKFLLAGAVALMAFSGCSDDVEEPIVPDQGNNQNQGNNQESEHDETYYAENASISCSDPKFTVTDDGVVVSFKVSGGEITIDVDCGTEWTAQNSAEDIFNCSIKSTSVTITAGQNLVEAELTGTIMLVTMPSQIEFATITVTQDAYGSPEITVETNEWHIPAVGELSTEITVNANYDWQVEKCDDWLKIEVTETGIILTAEENTETTEREGEVVLSCADEFNTDSETIRVTQDGLAYITLSEDELLVSKFEGATSVSVKSNFDWNYSYDTSNGWLTIDKDEEGSSLIVTYKENETGGDREVVVTITTGDGAENIAEGELKIRQSCEDIDILILEYTFTSNSTVTIKLPIYDVTDATIDWGDGTIETTSTNNPSHRYDYSGVYDVSISGTVKRLTSISSGPIAGTEYLTAVKQWGNTGLTSMENAFYGCSNLASFPDEAGPFSNVTTFYDAFCKCSALTEIPQKIFSKSTTATSFSSCFYNCASLTTIPENLFSNCVSATSFSSCFDNCASLTTIPENLFSNCVSATSFSSCFCDCASLTTISENLFSNCASVTSFSSCFYNCASLTTIPENLFSDCTSATDFRYCFSKCTSLTTVPENLFSVCASATDFSSCFFDCYSLVVAPSFMGCSAVTDFSSCFTNCESLTTIPDNIFSDCAVVTNFSHCFGSCSSLTFISEDIFSNCTAVKDFSYCFCNCESLTTVSDNIFSDCTAATNFSHCFGSCSSLTFISEDIFSNCTAVSSFSYCFSNCSSLISAPSFAGHSKVTTFEQTFRKCTSLTTVPENIFSGCTGVKDFSQCFDYCSSLIALPEDLFSDCTAVTDFLETFRECTALKCVPISLFDNNLSATSFYNTFYGCCSIVGESPYIEISVDGERVNVHLYDRSKYASNLLCKTPTVYDNCFCGSSFSDIDSIPSSWGGNKK